MVLTGDADGWCHKWLMYQPLSCRDVDVFRPKGGGCANNWSKICLITSPLCQTTKSCHCCHNDFLVCSGVSLTKRMMISNLRILGHKFLSKFFPLQKQLN